MNLTHVMTLEEFRLHCIHKKCLRQTFYTNNCSKLVKQESCYKKYLRKLEKQAIKNGLDEKDLEFRSRILKRDKTCRVWACLNNDERNFILDNFHDSFIILLKPLDVCHVLARSERPDLIYDEFNVFLASRYFHSLLDTYRDLVTQRPMSKEQRVQWLNRIMQSNKLWDESTDYNKFKEG